MTNKKEKFKKVLVVKVFFDEDLINDKNVKTTDEAIGSILREAVSNELKMANRRISKVNKAVELTLKIKTAKL